MKVIIIEVTRAANSFTRTHLPQIRQAYDLMAKIVRDAQESGAFRTDVNPDFASMWFYGAIEQLLSGWVFGMVGNQTTRTSTGPARWWSRRSQQPGEGCGQRPLRVPRMVYCTPHG